MPLLKRIIITDKKLGLPFSKGLLAKSIMAAGMSPKQAYHIAERVEDNLRKKNLFNVKSNQLRKIIVEVLEIQAGPDKTEKYKKWHALGALDRPLIVLIGGTTGVGKSTIASETAHRLAIDRLVSTDSIREVMRAVFSKELTPTLHESSYNAWKAIRAPVDDKTDPMVAGFMEQTAVASVGIEAIIQRGIKENLHMVVEGIHIVPGFLNLKSFSSAFVIPLIIGVEEEKAHKSHFYIRGVQTRGNRPYKKYVDNFDRIRKIGFYIEELARKNSVPIIQSYSLDATITDVLDEIYKQVQSQHSLLKKSSRKSAKA